MSSTSNLNLWLEDLFNDQTGIKVRVRDVLHAENTPFQRIAVYDTTAFGRVLTLGGSIAITDHDEAIYSEMLVHPALSTLKNPERVLVLGGGDGGVAREVLRHPSVQQVTVVEIDRQVVEVCRRWFPDAAKAYEDPRVKLVIDDAHRWLAACQEHYDAIIVDAVELADSASDDFYDRTFADTVFARLKQGGVLISPLGDPVFEPDLCRSALRKLKGRLASHTYLMAVPSYPGSVWAVAWCGAGDHTTVVSVPDQVEQLMAWTPELQQAMFVLPKDIARHLGHG
jgi:spermidine synthase